MARRKNGRTLSLESEVIGAVVVLYLAICGAMLAIHYLQPAQQITRTSSASPSHASFKAGDASDPDARAPR